MVNTNVGDDMPLPTQAKGAHSPNAGFGSEYPSPRYDDQPDRGARDRDRGGQGQSNRAAGQPINQLRRQPPSQTQNGGNSNSNFMPSSGGESPRGSRNGAPVVQARSRLSLLKNKIRNSENSSAASSGRNSRSDGMDYGNYGGGGGGVPPSLERSNSDVNINMVRHANARGGDEDEDLMYSPRMPGGGGGHRSGQPKTAPTRGNQSQSNRQNQRDSNSNRERGRDREREREDRELELQLEHDLEYDVEDDGLGYSAAHSRRSQPSNSSNARSRHVQDGDLEQVGGGKTAFTFNGSKYDGQDQDQTRDTNTNESSNSHHRNRNRGNRDTRDDGIGNNSNNGNNGNNSGSGINSGGYDLSSLDPHPQDPGGGDIYAAAANHPDAYPPGESAPTASSREVR